MSIHFYFVPYTVPIPVFTTVPKCPVRLSSSPSTPTQEPSANLVVKSPRLLYSDTTSLFVSMTSTCWAGQASFPQAVRFLLLSVLSLMVPLDLSFLPSVSYKLGVSVIGLMDSIHTFLIRNHRRWCCDLILHWDTSYLRTPLVSLATRLRW